MYEIKSLFYLQKVYTLSKNLLIYKKIACKDNIPFQALYLIRKRETLATSNVLSKNLSFFVYIRMNWNNRLGYIKLRKKLKYKLCKVRYDIILHLVSKVL